VVAATRWQGLGVTGNFPMAFREEVTCLDTGAPCRFLG